MITVTATDIQNNFGHYLQAVQQGDEIIILKNGKEVARLVSRESSVSFLQIRLQAFLKMTMMMKLFVQKGQNHIKILVDTNVILDVLCNRSEFVEASSKV